MSRGRGGFRQEYAALIGAAWRVIRQGGWRLAAVYLIGQGMIALIATPLLRWLFAEALRAAGLAGVDTSTLPRLITTPLSIGLLIAVVVIAFIVLSFQYLMLVVTIRRVQAGERLFARETLGELGILGKKLLRPSALPLLPYLFLLLPLGGIGFMSVLSQAITIPSFITGELMKTTGGLLAYLAFLLVLAFLNIQLALAVPLFATTGASGGGALRSSWRLVRGHRIVLVLVIFTVFVAGAIVGGALIGIGLGPVALADAFLPDAAPIVAAVMLAVAQVGAMITVGIGAVMIVTVLVVLATQPGSTMVAPTAERRHRLSWVPALCIAVLVIGLSAVNIPVMNALSREPSTLVLAHRGDTADAVENTIASLKAARDADADFVEMDVMETADRRFVVMHDAELTRLTGEAGKVGDLTLDELVAMTVHDSQGNSDRIPSLEEYVTVAHDIEQPLLIEIKLHGGESPDLVPRLVDELEDLGVLENNIYHSLDKDSVEELKRLRPDLTVGLTMALAGIGVPDTAADFLVIEEWSFTPEMNDAAHQAGLGAMVWTVNEEQRVRELMRDDADGIITDITAAAVRERESIQDSTGLSSVLFDALQRYVVIF
ncbi:glycerophosphoryl diester phosphodiesterase membrane domain-containing protein [Microbacterium sp. A196]|uniref:glycerophosphoryl diester phosphodiesterase membrane domain-containing protein n=1 Tax=unclassified Microbacterium TaxID=2609290 RepID=UPI003FCFFA9A